MMSDPVALGQPTVGAAELAAVAEVFASGWLSGAGPTCEAFERRFAGTAGTAHAVATSSCGSALHLALLVLGAGPGDEVVVADYTFPATGPRGAVDRRDAGLRRRAGGHLGRRPAARSRRRSPRAPSASWPSTRSASRPTTTSCARSRTATACSWWRTPPALQARRTGGAPRAASPTSRASASTGARGSPPGRAARSPPTTTGGPTPPAGCTPTASRRLADGGAARRCRSRPSTEAGYNYRMSDVQAAHPARAAGPAARRCSRRRGEVARAYGELLADLEQVELPYAAPDRSHPWQSYVLAVHPGLDRGAVALALRARGIGCTIGTYASHLQPVYGPQKPLPVSADLFARHLAIPMHANLTDAGGRPRRGGRARGRRAARRTPLNAARHGTRGGHHGERPDRARHRRGRLDRAAHRPAPARARLPGAHPGQHGPRRPGRGRAPGRSPATSSWSSRTCGTAARCTQAMKGATHVMHYAAVSINKSQADPYESMDDQHGRQPQRVRRGRRPRRAPAGVRLQRVGVRRPRPAADERGQHRCTRSRRTASASGPVRTCSGSTSAGPGCPGSRCGSSTSTAPGRRRPPTTPR